MALQRSRLTALLVTLAILSAGCGPASPTRPSGTPSGEAAGSTAPSAGSTTPAPTGGPGPSQEGAANTPPGTGCVMAAAAQGHPPYGYLRPDKNVQSGICEAFAAVEGFNIDFTLPGPVPEETIRKALQVEGTGRPSQVYVADASVSVRFSEGKNDDVTTVRLVGPLGENGAPVDLGFRVRSRPSPFITAELMAGDGTWRPIPQGATVPAGPLTLRFRLHGHPDRDMVARAVQEAFAPKKDDTSRIPVKLDWEADDLLVLNLPVPPPLVQIFIGMIPGDYGLQGRQFYLAFYTGELPSLVSVDPASGREAPLGSAPADIWEHFASPDGKWVLLDALQGSSTYAMDLWLLHTPTGTLELTGLHASNSNMYRWLGDRLVVPTAESVQILSLMTMKVVASPSQAQGWEALSPDGRFLAGFTQDGRREDPDTWLAPSAVIIHDLTTHKEQVFPDAARVGVRHSEASPTMRMAWSADGDTLFFEEYRPVSGGKQRTEPHWLAIDRETGKIAEPASHPDVPPQARINPPGPTGWSFEQPQPWDRIVLHGPDGSAREAGRGLPVGWRPDGSLLVIRWGNAAYRRSPGI